MSGPGPQRFSLAFLFSQHLPELLIAMKKEIILWAQPAHLSPLLQGTRIPTIRSNYTPPPAMNRALSCKAHANSSSLYPGPTSHSYFTFETHLRSFSHSAKECSSLLEASGTFSQYFYYTIVWLFVFYELFGSSSHVFLMNSESKVAF